jgi:hypothetical protein
MSFEKNIYKQWGWRLGKNKIIHFYLIKITKMYNDNILKINCLSLWISYTLTNKKKTFLNKNIKRIEEIKPN